MVFLSPQITPIMARLMSPSFKFKTLFCENVKVGDIIESNQREKGKSMLDVVDPPSIEITNEPKKSPKEIEIESKKKKKIIN